MVCRIITAVLVLPGRIFIFRLKEAARSGVEAAEVFLNRTHGVTMFTSTRPRRYVRRENDVRQGVATDARAERRDDAPVQRHEGG